MDCLAAAASASNSALAWPTLTPGRLAGGVQSGVALGVPLLHALLANLVDLGARLAQFGGVLGCPGFGPGDGLVRILNRAFGACTALFQRGGQRSLNQELVRQHQHDEQQAVGTAPSSRFPTCWIISGMLVPMLQTLNLNSVAEMLFAGGTHFL